MAAGAWLIQIASFAALTSSFVRPVLTLSGKASASQPASASASRLWMRSHWLPASSSNGRRPPPSPVAAPRPRPLVRTIVKRPRSFSPRRLNFSSPSVIALTGSCFAQEGAASCYANCDASTTQPCLNVLDFTCFLNQFAAGASYANCDASTTPPVLNVLDFTCFLNRFAAGCSGC